MSAEHDAAVNAARDDKESRTRGTAEQGKGKEGTEEEEERARRSRSNREQKSAEEMRTAGWLLLGAGACLALSRSMK
jgi:hypothetical protein